MKCGQSNSYYYIALLWTRCNDYIHWNIVIEQNNADFLRENLKKIKNYKKADNHKPKPTPQLLGTLP